METTTAVERVVVSAQIRTTEHEQLQRMANAADRSLSAEIRRALRSHITGRRGTATPGGAPVQASGCPRYSSQ